MTTTVSAHPIERILPLLKGVRTLHNGRGYSACCPAHGDSHQSLSIWEDGSDRTGICCFAGCTQEAVLQALNLTWQDLYKNAEAKSAPTGGITLMDLAADKMIHPSRLVQLGITDGYRNHSKHSVHIPYYTQDGKAYARYRIRTALAAKEGSSWSEGSEPPIPYGLQLLEDARRAGELTIVEGESDCWTSWRHDFPAIGIPGVKTFKCLKIEYLNNINVLYIIQEPPTEKDRDQGRDPGRDFVESLYKHLVSQGYKGKAYAVNLMETHQVKDPNELHKRDIKGFKAAFEQAKLRAQPLHKERPKPATTTLKALMQKKLPEMRWAIPDILPEGFTLLCGKPKLGKSWLGLGFALDKAAGGYALGKKQVEPGEVLYLALEDNERRLQSRINVVMESERYNGHPDGLEIATDWPRLDEGGYEALEEWITTHPKASLIIVDTWAKVAPIPQGRKRTQYEEDYTALGILKKLADDYRISVLAVHHLRKMESADVLDQISGSTGLTGAVDGFLVLKRERGQFDAKLYVTGRDIEDEQELELSFDKITATWTVEGNAEDLAKTRERQAIFDLLRAHPDGLGARAISEMLSKNYHTIRNLLARLVNEGKIRHTNNKYIVVSVVSVVSNSQRSQRSYEPTDSQTTPKKAKKGDYASASNDYGLAPTVVTPNQPVEQRNGHSDYGDYGDYRKKDLEVVEL